jgi:site-specific DNA recombinase
LVNLRDETRKGLRGRLNQGIYPYKAPLGYLDQGRGKLKTPDPARAPLVREMFELYATGQYSLRSLAKEMERRGLKSRTGRPVSRSSIEKLLANPFYTGVIRILRTGETYTGAHEPLITVSLFERVQDIKAGRYGKKATRHSYTYRGGDRPRHRRAGPAVLDPGVSVDELQDSF